MNSSAQLTVAAARISLAGRPACARSRNSSDWYLEPRAAADTGQQQTCGRTVVGQMRQTCSRHRHLPPQWKERTEGWPTHCTRRVRDMQNCYQTAPAQTCLRPGPHCTSTRTYWAHVNAHTSTAHCWQRPPPEPVCAHSLVHSPEQVAPKCHLDIGGPCDRQRLQALGHSLPHLGHELSRHAACNALPLQGLVCNRGRHQESPVSCTAAAAASKQPWWRHTSHSNTLHTGLWTRCRRLQDSQGGETPASP